MTPAFSGLTVKQRLRLEAWLRRTKISKGEPPCAACTAAKVAEKAQYRAAKRAS